MLSVSLRLRYRSIRSVLGVCDAVHRERGYSTTRVTNDYTKIKAQDKARLRDVKTSTRSIDKPEVKSEPDDLFDDLLYDPELRRDPKIWNNLSQHLKSIQGQEGLDRVWSFFKQFPLHEVPILYDIDLWNYVKGAESIEYVQKLGEAGIQPPSDSRRAARPKHAALELPQSSHEDLVEAALQDLDVELPPGSYDKLISRLCMQGDHEIAIRWHRKLIARGDMPQSEAASQQLRQLLLKNRQWSNAIEVKRDASLLRSGPTGGRTGIGFLDQDITHVERRQVLQNFVNKLDERVGVTKKVSSMDDYTCARFFATKFFSVQFIMEGLLLFNVESLGSLSIREIVKRTIRNHSCDSLLAQKQFESLSRLNVSCSTRYGRLLEHLAFAREDLLLHSIVTSESPPDTFDNMDEQEKLLQSSDSLIVERTRVVLNFENEAHDVEIQNMMIRQGLLNFEEALAKGVPITRKTQAKLIASVYITKMPWISERKLRSLVRNFARIPQDQVDPRTWQKLIWIFTYIVRPHLRHDMERLLLCLKDPRIFDQRTIGNLIRWYNRLGSLGSTTRMTTLLGGFKVLAVLRDRGLVSDIHLASEATLATLFNNTPLVEPIDQRRRQVSQNIGTMQDFIVAIRELYDENMWYGKKPTEVKEMILANAEKLKELRLEKYGPEGSRPRSHTGVYNPGRMAYLQVQLEQDPSSENRGESENTESRNLEDASKV